jgi:propanol-preferring alcohol dehydrogenase
MSDIPAFPYADLWGERSIRSIANLTREDGETFFAAAQAANVRTVTTLFALHEANEAIAHVRSGDLNGAAVLFPPGAQYRP